MRKKNPVKLKKSTLKSTEKVLCTNAVFMQNLRSSFALLVSEVS